jgi:hypothetical protein
VSANVPHWEVIKANPTLMVLDPLQLLQDLLLSVVRSLDYFPKVYELVVLDRSIVVIVDSVKKFLGADPAESLVPVVDGFLLLDRA